MDKDELYSALTCALVHDLKVCDGCRKCPGKNFIEIRMNLIREVAKYMGKDTPWIEEHNQNEYHLDTNYTYNTYDDTISRINSWDNYKLPDDYDNTISKLNSWDYNVNWTYEDIPDELKIDTKYTYSAPTETSKWNLDYLKKDN